MQEAPAGSEQAEEEDLSDDDDEESEACLRLPSLRPWRLLTVHIGLIHGFQVSWTSSKCQEQRRRAVPRQTPTRRVQRLQNLPLSVRAVRAEDKSSDCC